MRKKVKGKGASRRPRRSFTASFKAEVVALVHELRGVPGAWVVYRAR
jgi:transposase-like protein